MIRISLRNILYSWSVLGFFLLLTIILPFVIDLSWLGIHDLDSDEGLGRFFILYTSINGVVLFIICLKAIKHFSARNTLSVLLFITFAIIQYKVWYADYFKEEFYDSSAGFVLYYPLFMPQLCVLCAGLTRMFLTSKRRTVAVNPDSLTAKQFIYFCIFTITGLWFAGTRLLYVLFKQNINVWSELVLLCLGLWLLSLPQYRLLWRALTKIFYAIAYLIRSALETERLTVVLNFEEKKTNPSHKSLPPLPPIPLEIPSELERKTVSTKKKRFWEYGFPELGSYLLKRVRAPKNYKEYETVWLIYAFCVYAFPLFAVAFTVLIYSLRKSAFDHEWGLHLFLNLITFGTVYLHAKIPVLTAKFEQFITIYYAFDKLDEKEKAKVELPSYLVSLKQISLQVFTSVSVIMISSLVGVIGFNVFDADIATINKKGFLTIIYNIFDWALIGGIILLCIILAYLFIQTYVFTGYQAFKYHQMKHK